eukprot:6475378-Amphidinium_carterae.1
MEADRIKPTITIQSLLKMHERCLKPMLRSMKLMVHKNTEVRHCQVCGKLFGRDGRCGSRRCTARNVRAGKQRAEDGRYVISVHHNAADLHMQAAAVLCATVGIGAAQCHLLTGADHKLVERVYGSLRSVVAAKVLELQASINLNSTLEWVDCEADEVTLCKKRVGQGTVKWTQYLGIMRRGCPESLILVKMRDRTTIARAPGPGPLRTEEWLEVGRPLLEDKHIILHTDSARAYAAPFNTMRHTR